MRLGRINNNFTAEGFALTKAEGLDFCEICCNFAEDAQKLIDAKESVKELVNSTGIEVSCVGRWNHDLNEHGSINEEKLAQYIELMEAAIYLGAKTFVCGCNYDKDISLYRNYTNAIYMFKKLVEKANGRIKIAVQNCHWNNFIVSPKQWEVVLGEIPELCIKYDASHTYLRNEDYIAELSNWGDRVAHVHIKGIIQAGKIGVDSPPAGMDDLRWEPIFALLYASGYDGDLSIEPHSKVWQGELGEAGIRYTRDFIRKFML